MNLRKSKDNVMVTGLLAGIGEYYDLDPSIVRITFVILASFGALPMVPLYIIGALIVPRAKDSKKDSNRKQKNKQKIDKEKADPHNIDSLSETEEIDEDDWSDF